jgi:hypothetical protein
MVGQDALFRLKSLVEDHLAEYSPRTHRKILPEMETAYNCVYLEFHNLSLVESGVEPWPGPSIGANRLR